MISWIQELPDWSVGLVAGATVWTGISYAVLAPRAMSEELENNIYPTCIAQLDAEQDRAIAMAEARLQQEHHNKRETAVSSIREKEQNLRAFEFTQKEVGKLTGMLGQYGLDSIISIPGADMLSDVDVGKLREEIQEAKSILLRPLNLDLPRVGRSELLKTCTCAVAQTVAGERMNYTLSMASFRLISPSDVSSFKRGISDALNANICGQKPWRAL